MFDIAKALNAVVESGASDLHLKTDALPTVRLHGQLSPLDGFDRLCGSDTEAVLAELLEDQERLNGFKVDGEADFSYGLQSGARFRVNAFKQRGEVSIVCRVIPADVPTLAELGVPAVITELAQEQRGIVLCTGATGSGKSTTLAAIVNHINLNFAKHIVTIEDPIEYLHSDKRSIVNQREIGIDTASFNRALRRVLRQDPDVILIGEMRDEETVRTALTAAQTGHLVLSTLHTLDAVESVTRIVDFFPPHEQQQARVMLAGTLKGVIGQRLIPTVNHDSRVAACEVLTMTGRVKDLILRPEETGKLGDVIAEGSYYGMQTFDQALLSLYKGGTISFDDAVKVATRPHDFKLMVEAEVGAVATAEVSP